MADKPIRTGRGKGSSKRRSRKLKVERTTHESNTARVIDSGKYYECYEDTETPEDHIVPRKSLTRKLGLKLFDPQIETEARKTRQLDKLDPAKRRMIETTDQRLTWKSDTSLLKQGKPESRIGTFKRLTSKSKRLQTIREDDPAAVEVVIDDTLGLPDDKT